MRAHRTTGTARTARGSGFFKDPVLARYRASGGQFLAEVGGPASVSRASAEYTWDGASSVGNNVLAVTSSGAQIWGSVANKGIRSQEFASWNHSFGINTTGMSDTAVAPDGTTTADSLVEDGTNAEHAVGIYWSSTVATYTMSVYAKPMTPATRTWIAMAMDYSSYYYFDLVNGVMASGAGTDGNLTGKSITAVGGGWYRCSITRVMPAGTAWATILLAVPSPNKTSYQGDNASGVYLWGAQIELGAVPGPYVATAGSVPVTKPASVVTVPNTMSPASWAVAVTTRVPNWGTRLPLWSMGTRNAANSAELITDVSGSNYVSFKVFGYDGYDQEATYTHAFIENSTHKIVAWFEAGTLRLYVDGTLVTTETPSGEGSSGLMDVMPATINLGKFTVTGTDYYLNGWASEFTLASTYSPSI